MKVSDFLVMSLKSHARACQTIISLKTVSKFNFTGGHTVVELNLLKARTGAHGKSLMDLPRNSHGDH